MRTTKWAEQLTQPIHYSKAPIIEALIDIQTVRFPASAMPSLKSLNLRGYREVQVLGEFKSEVRIEKQAPIASASGGPFGFRFQSASDKYVLQARLNGFTFSRLAPYESWDLFVSEARSGWAAYRKAVGKVSVTQVSVRYINKIHMPAGSDMKQYLRTSPEVSPDLPQMLSGTFMRLEIPYLSPSALLVHQQFYAPPDEPGKIGMILDNEVKITSGLEAVSNTELWNRIEELRGVKNQAFRGCLTQKMEDILA